MSPAFFSAMGLCLTASTPRPLAAQCVAKPSSCAEFVSVGRGSGRVMVYRSHPLAARNDSIARALIIIHGAERAARWEFRSALAGAYLRGSLETTLIVALRFTANDGRGCGDSLSTHELNWGCDVQRGDWRVGGVAQNDSATSSFDAVDAILLTLNAKAVFPNLKSIVVAGHSAGGQFVTLYQAVNQVHERIGADVSYVAANSSAYAYLDGRRPIPPDSATAKTVFAAFAGSQACPAYGNWPFGLGNRSGYAARLTEAQVKEQAVRRPVTYLLGELDVTPPGGFFGSCAGMAQGSNRFVRGMAFAQYMADFGRAPHKAVVVDGCPHDARCVYTSDDALAALFPNR